MSLIAYVFPSAISEKPRIVNILKGPKHCWNLRDRFFHIFSSLWENFGLKTSLLVILKILGLFLHILTADDKYSLCNKDNLQQPIHMKFCKKQKLLPELSTASVKFTFNFQYFEKILPRFRTLLDSQHVKGSQTLLKSARQ